MLVKCNAPLWVFSGTNPAGLTSHLRFHRLDTKQLQYPAGSHIICPLLINAFLTAVGFCPAHFEVRLKEFSLLHIVNSTNFSFREMNL